MVKLRPLSNCMEAEMAREKTLKVSVVNVKTQPHSPDNYTNLWQSTFRHSQPGKIRGSDWGVIGTSFKNKIGNNEHVIHGTIFKFLNIDPRGDWLDLKFRTPINAEEDGSVPPIPDHLKPNLKKVFYLFNPNVHRLFFDRKYISPGSMKLLLESLFSESDIYEQFGTVDVEVQSTKEAINKILSIPKLTRLSIDFSFPNADDLSDTERKVLKRYEERRIRKHSQVSTTTHEKGIKPDQDMEAKMNIARSNGRVIAIGYDGEKKIKYSTKNHPLIEHIRYDPDFDTVYDAMLMASTGMIKKIRG